MELKIKTSQGLQPLCSIQNQRPSIDSMDKLILSDDSIPLATWFSTQLTSSDSDVTTYAVMKAPQGDGGSGELVLMGIPYELSNGNCPCIYVNSYTNQVQATIYGSNIDLNNITSDTYHVYTISIDSINKKASFYVDGVKKLNLTFTHSGGYVVIGSGLPDGTRYNGRRPKCKYLGVVETCHSDADIIAKQQELMTKYNIS